MTEPRKQHWDRVFTTKEPEQVSWFQAEPTVSLQLLESGGLSPSS